MKPIDETNEDYADEINDLHRIQGKRMKKIDRSERLLRSIDKFMEIIEGPRARRWVARGYRLTDTPEWCEVYCAWCALQRHFTEQASKAYLKRQ